MSARQYALALMALAAAIQVALVAQAQAQPPDDRGFDPTGVWYGQHGPLALVRAGDTLSFSYSGVFSAQALICDGIGIAGFSGDGEWEYIDEQGTVTFTTKNRKPTSSSSGPLR